MSEDISPFFFDGDGGYLSDQVNISDLWFCVRSEFAEYSRPR